MATLEHVDDPSDPRLLPYLHLTDVALRHRVEEREAMFVVEGKVAIRRLFASPYPVRSVVVTPARWADLAADLEPHDVAVYVVPRPVLAAVTGFDVHRGALAVAGRLEPHDPAALVARAGCVLVLEGIGDQENLGALARTARAFAADGLLLDPTCADPLYRRAVRVSMGEVLFLPFARLEPWPAALDRITEAGLTTIALTPAPDAEPIEEVAADPPARPALLLGAEGPGLSAAALARADRRVRIPIHPGVDSLNVGHAAAIALHRLGPLARR